MNRPLRRLAFSLFIMFGVLVGTVTYLQAIAGPDYRDDPRNARVAAGRTGRERGGIISVDGTVVAQSVADPDDPRVFRRDYPEGSLYAHVAGYSTLLFGDSGMEEAAAGRLASGRDATISGVLLALTGDDLRPRGLRLTLDDSLQRTALAALGSQPGAVVVLDPATGAVLAMVSSPSFDPNTLLGIDATPAGDALAADLGQPLLNRAISATYAPGSVFKVITAATALETGTAGPETRFDDPVELELPNSTATIKNFDEEVCADGVEVTLAVAFARSCNTVFGRIGMDAGADALVGQAESFGINRTIPFDLDVVESVVPGEEGLSQDPAALAQTALGQRDVRVTPLQMAMVGATVANGGEMMTPYLIAEEFNADAEVVRTTEPVAWRRAISPATADVLTDLMERVVTSGTGTRAAVPGVRVAGKTGTAEVPGAPPHAWFIGFGPIEPEPGQRPIALAVLVESGGEAGEAATGGTVAAPIARQLFAEWLGIPE